MKQRENSGTSKQHFIKCISYFMHCNTPYTKTTMQISSWMKTMIRYKIQVKKKNVKNKRKTEKKNNQKKIKHAIFVEHHRKAEKGGDGKWLQSNLGSWWETIPAGLCSSIKTRDCRQPKKQSAGSAPAEVCSWAILVWKGVETTFFLQERSGDVSHFGRVNTNCRKHFTLLSRKQSSNNFDM